MVGKAKTIYSSLRKEHVSTSATIRTVDDRYDDLTFVIADKGMTRADCEARLARLDKIKQAVAPRMEVFHFVPSVADADDLALVLESDAALETLSRTDAARLRSLAALHGSFGDDKQAKIAAAARLCYRLEHVEREFEICESLGLGRKVLRAINAQERVRLRAQLDSPWAKVSSMDDVVFSEEEAAKRRLRILHKLEAKGTTRRCKCCTYRKHAPRYTSRKDCRDVTRLRVRDWATEDNDIDDDVANAFCHDEDEDEDMRCWQCDTDAENTDRIDGSTFAGAAT
ncbi:hypothetical protein SPRG_13818 [Saprolegnia parasitica CBS 223.65]|uniref:Uncharacterized protein n=1 Tax=Saprolegnia parasitica (strain CBS 223.65) TaxID=695850 RepID=A0A067C2U5_SAPPC|nr:hypothetical protein SPRG_13818 [Saprolegnia parasitica CBS 223.65]KDO21112.1 hypothetical protein SPRG_13818 [Saprolegnia parasitica CBS 223.65]|eukprot:XP_012208204.1 hypothetical protein SPRG_13818 [Saprolegnia parasitica CBS 223.65]